MKFTLTLSVVCLIGLIQRSWGQGSFTFTYDQQSSDESFYLDMAAPIQRSQPFGQSFTPSLSAVGFIRLNLASHALTNVADTLVFINLRSDSITGAVLSATIPIVAPAGGPWGGTMNFFFSNPVPITPGQTYYFQPVVQSGANSTNFYANVDFYHYAGGDAYVNGLATGEDFWFREGTYVPEPSPSSLAVLAGSVWWFFQRRRSLDVLKQG
jgi:hypothetical protein